MIFYLLNLLFLNGYNAHISMSFPISRRNKLSEYYRNTNNVNYDIRSPLYTNTDKFTFPCKGFPVGPPTTTYNSNSISVTLEGTAIHGGGHCQFGVSYDNKNFLVLKTVLNSCLLDSMSYTFTLPDKAPGGNLTVFWTWINRIGNREYYMECADVTVNNGILKNTILKGKELIIANILNYPTIPEWPVGASPLIDGRYLFEKAKNISIHTNQQKNDHSNSNIASITTTPYITPYITTSNITKSINEISKTIPYIQITPFAKIQSHECEELYKCNQNGLMVCFENGFYTCANNKWLYRSCPSGTFCKQKQTSIICDN
jgi:ribosomal protein S15P/S13E